MHFRQFLVFPYMCIYTHMCIYRYFEDFGGLNTSMMRSGIRDEAWEQSEVTDQVFEHSDFRLCTGLFGNLCANPCEDLCAGRWGGEARNKGLALLRAYFPLTAIPRRTHRISSDLRS